MLAIQSKRNQRNYWLRSRLRAKSSASVKRWTVEDDSLSDCDWGEGVENVELKANKMGYILYDARRASRLSASKATTHLVGNMDDGA